jgi:hypothetical protein
MNARERVGEEHKSRDYTFPYLIFSPRSFPFWLFPSLPENVRCAPHLSESVRELGKLIAVEIAFFISNNKESLDTNAVNWNVGSSNKIPRSENRRGFFE